MITYVMKDGTVKKSLKGVKVPEEIRRKINVYSNRSDTHRRRDISDVSVVRND